MKKIYFQCFQEDNSETIESDVTPIFFEKVCSRTLRACRVRSSWARQKQTHQSWPGAIPLTTPLSHLAKCKVRKLEDRTHLTQRNGHQIDLGRWVRLESDDASDWVEVEREREVTNRGPADRHMQRREENGRAPATVALAFTKNVVFKGVSGMALFFSTQNVNHIACFHRQVPPFQLTGTLGMLDAGTRV